MTNEKLSEVYQEIQTHSILCLTETQKKIDNIRTSDQIKVISKMREVDERKGGGLMVLYREEEDFYFEKVAGGWNDCLDLRGKMGKENINMSIVYLRTGREREVLEHNKNVLEHISRKAEEAERKEEMYITCGDFNAHLGYLGDQDENENGRLVNLFIEESGLILMNIDEKCTGTYTWERGEWKSAIDLVLTNERVYGKFKKMMIDERREVLDISDHCMIIVDMEMENGESGE